MADKRTEHKDDGGKHPYPGDDFRNSVGALRDELRRYEAKAKSSRGDTQKLYTRLAKNRKRDLEQFKGALNEEPAREPLQKAQPPKRSDYYEKNKRPKGKSVDDKPIEVHVNR